MELISGSCHIFLSQTVFAHYLQRQMYMHVFNLFFWKEKYVPRPKGIQKLVDSPYSKVMKTERGGFSSRNPRSIVRFLNVGFIGRGGLSRRNPRIIGF